jgi:hypothetical protein
LLKWNCYCSITKFVSVMLAMTQCTESMFTCTAERFCAADCFSTKIALQAQKNTDSTRLPSQTPHMWLLHSDWAQQYNLTRTSITQLFGTPEMGRLLRFHILDTGRPPFLLYANVMAGNTDVLEDLSTLDPQNETVHSKMGQ